MGKPVNLNRFAKQKARAADKARADQNAVQHGRRKSDRDRTLAKAEIARRALDGHKPEP